MEAYLACCAMQVKVFWPAMGRWYIGKVSTFDAKSGKHTVQFKDGDKREYTMRHEAVVWLDVPGIDGASAAARLEPGWQDEEVCILASAPLRNQTLPCAYTADSNYGCWAVTQSLNSQAGIGQQKLQACHAVELSLQSTSESRL